MKSGCGVYEKAILKGLLADLTITHAEFYQRGNDRCWKKVREVVAGDFDSDPLNFPIALLILKESADQ